MKTALIWAINDFLVYGMISSWSTYGKLKCSYYIENNKAFMLTNNGKTSFLLPMTVIANISQIYK